MNIKFKHIGIICYQNTPGRKATLKALVCHLQQKKVNIVLETDTASIFSQPQIPQINYTLLHEHCDLIIVIGGDGSMLRAAHIAAQHNLPIIGINRGTLGFLTDIMPQELSKIDAILQGNFYQEQRILLTTKIYNKHQHLTKALAINDVVLFSHLAGQMIEFSVYVDQEFLSTYRADGLIITTPTGSTAHALSSGGPILHPTMASLAIVPVQSHNLSSRPIVLAGNSIIKIVFTKYKTKELLVICDGQIKAQLQEGSIEIKRAHKNLKLLHPQNYNYFTTLRTKLNWEKHTTIINRH